MVRRMSFQRMLEGDLDLLSLTLEGRAYNTGHICSVGLLEALAKASILPFGKKKPVSQVIGFLGPVECSLVNSKTLKEVHNLF